MPCLLLPPLKLQVIRSSLGQEVRNAQQNLIKQIGFWQRTTPYFYKQCHRILNDNARHSYLNSQVSNANTKAPTLEFKQSFKFYASSRGKRKDSGYWNSTLHFLIPCWYWFLHTLHRKFPFLKTGFTLCP